MDKNDMKEKIEADGVLLEHYPTDITGHSNSGDESIYYYKNRFYVIGTCGDFDSEGTCSGCDLDDCDFIHKGFMVTELVRNQVELIMRLETDYKDKILSADKIYSKISDKKDKNVKAGIKKSGATSELDIFKFHAEYLIKNKVLAKGFSIVCKGWSADNDYQEITDEYLNEDGEFDENYFDFKIWKG
jgi:hypothetical protein